MKYFLVLTIIFFAGCNVNKSNIAQTVKEEEMIDTSKYSVATFGSGCFWCTEAIFELVNGVIKVESGYSGGNVPEPTYEAVCSGLTGHAEVIQIFYDPEKILYPQLLEIFWKTHDPTTLNRQGADVGTQYRSVIFYHNDEQKKLATEYKKKLDDAKIWGDPIVTEITQFKKFYKAEDYHQNYYANNPYQGYCSFVITPKIEKFKKVFTDKLK
ncbi:MAG: peptide-methionine (S)-S-oxide reductase MsrA [Melioribacteraceae bacterium]|nr:peptide-methionine (S)-S-oxide reductase MsrA [Melioribacteraceae bacterium]